MEGCEYNSGIIAKESHQKVMDFTDPEECERIPFQGMMDLDRVRGQDVKSRGDRECGDAWFQPFISYTGFDWWAQPIMVRDGRFGLSDAANGSEACGVVEALIQLQQPGKIRPAILAS
jgi:hypothetical protein